MRLLLILFLLQASATLQPFAYEIERAKRTLGEYGAYTYRDERIHRRTAGRGSTVDTYCAVTQSRGHDGKVEERVFYWVLRVKPAAGFLSDYERGSWSSPPPNEMDDFRKLCIDTNPLGDSELLRSTKHRSSGSTYDPTAETSPVVSRDWLIGSWVAADSCATSYDSFFRADGQYDGADESGRWELHGTTVRLTITEKAPPESDTGGGDPGFLPLPKPEVRDVPIERLGIDRMRMNRDYVLRRC